MAVSAVSAEIVGGTLPEKRFSLMPLRHNVSVRAPDSTGRLPAARGVQLDQHGERRDAPRDRAGEAVRGQEPDHAQCSMRPHGTNRQRAARRSCKEACAASAGARPMY
jgi:hypothetical protein